MEEEQKSLFDEAEVSEEMPEQEPQIADDPADAEPVEFKPTVSTESPKDKKERLGEKKDMDGKTLTIKSYFFTKPRTKNQDGTPIPAKKTIDKTKEFYPGKLGIKFEEDNLVEYYPNFHYFLNETGNVSTHAKINRNGENAIASIFKLAVEKIGKPVDEVSDNEFYEFLIGQKVKIKTKKGTYLKRAWFRNDIEAFV